MKTVVLDASVVVKWVLPSRLEESHSKEALDILDWIQMARLDATPATSLACRGWRRFWRGSLPSGPRKPLTCSIRLNFPQ